tara:strand:+ start:3719 stop:4312 length:594 start_codon:yes stop_codon:yes gene_type:complete
MEIESAHLTSYIKIYDEFFNPDTSDIFLKICKDHPTFKDAGIIKDKEVWFIDKEVRDVKMWVLGNLGEKSRTNIFWTNYFAYKLNEYLKKYALDNKIKFSSAWCIQDMQVLKYEKGGKYNFHVDHGTLVPRTISCIYFVNDDYEGGELCFKLQGTEKEIIIEKKAGRIIMWPSNFLYPHAVKPVTKGTRYSVVAWAL